MAVDFHRAQRRAVTRITARQPNVGGTEEAVAAAVTVRCEIPPRSDKGTARAPTVNERKIGVHFVGGIGRCSSSAHDKHLLRKLWRFPQNRPGLTRGPWYIGNGGN